MFLYIFLLSVGASVVSAITGGLNVSPDEQLAFGYQVSIRLKKFEDSYGTGFVCSGTLISRQYVLTSAKCVYEFNNAWDNNNMKRKIREPKEFRLVLGNPYRSRPFKLMLERDVGMVSVHKEFDPVTGRYDLALLRMVNPLPNVVQGIGTARLRNTTLPVNTRCTVSGWGETSQEAAELSNVLVKGTVTSVAREHCNSMLPSSSNFPGVLCFSSDEAGVCGGDLGSPVICGNDLVGFVTVDGGCGRSSKHFVVTSVSDNFQWIRTNAGWRNPALKWLFLVITAIPTLIR